MVFYHHPLQTSRSQSQRHRQPSRRSQQDILIRHRVRSCRRRTFMRRARHKRRHRPDRSSSRHRQRTNSGRYDSRTRNSTRSRANFLHITRSRIELGLGEGDLVVVQVVDDVGASEEGVTKDALFICARITDSCFQLAKDHDLKRVTYLARRSPVRG
jgi:hypothetical protein